MISTPEAGYAPHERGFDYAFSYYASGVALWNSPAFWRNGVNVPAPGYTTHLLTDETLKFIDEHKDKPFFINLSYSVPHIPLSKHLLLSIWINLIQGMWRQINILPP
ncbi:arylsulfatase [Proteus mirabilis]|uniref:Arylsulfatase n=1 Tax=Proteus mirabilis TaxID=584 RepID=A0A379GEI6_PROMI|nr:arylsulfatase [Proteus mirabilis]